MKRFVMSLMTVLMLFIAGGAYADNAASDNGGLPEIAATEDEPIDALPEFVQAESGEGSADEASSPDSGDLPEIAATDDEPVDPLPEFVKAE